MAVVVARPWRILQGFARELAYVASAILPRRRFASTLGLMQFAISFAISVATFILLATVVEIMRRKGVDPVTSISNAVAPLPTGDA